jgi:tetratricopeptide (TPR) repeat protein
MRQRALRSICLGLALSPWVVPAWAQPTPASQSPPAATANSAEFARLRDLAASESEAGKTAEAVRDYQQALALQPDWKEGWWNLGMLQYSGSQFQDSKATFEKVTAFAPNLGIAWGLLGLSEYETGDYDQALGHLQKADALGMQDDDEISRVADYHLGLLLNRAGQFDRASTLLAAKFESGAMPEQVRIALGLATLRVPLLPQKIDPSREALVLAAGDAAIGDNPEGFSAILRAHPELPWLHLAYCRSLAKAGRAPEALEECQGETRISPESPLPWIEISRIELQQGALDESLQSARTAARLFPSAIEAHQMLAQAAQASGNTDEAEKEREVAATLPPLRAHPEERIVKLYANLSDQAQADEAAQARWKQALREYVAADYAAASADLKAWLASTPSSGTGWALLGLCEFALKDYDNALIHLDRSAKLGLNASSESIDQARYTYGILLVHAGRFDEAETILATASHPAGPLRQKVEFALGLALLRRAEFPDQTSATETELVSAAGRIAVLLEQSKYDEAFPQFKVLLDRYPSAPFLHYAYGTALIALSEFEPAAAQMQAERTLSPRSELPCVSLASIALRQSDPAPAVKWAQCALDLNHDSVDAHYLLGRASLEAGDVNTAIRELEIASNLSPESPEIHFNLARAYARAKMPDKAQRERETFSRLNDAQKASQSAHP